jgi:hypothetical protein
LPSLREMLRQEVVDRPRTLNGHGMTGIRPFHVARVETVNLFRVQNRQGVVGPLFYEHLFFVVIDCRDGRAGDLER